VTEEKRKAVYWDVRDDVEALEHEDPDEALVAYLDDLLDPLTISGPAVEKALREQVEAVKLYGYARTVVTDKRLRDESEWLVERLQESLDDDWGTDAAGDYTALDDETQERLVTKFTAALKEERDAGHILPWHCDLVETRVLSGDELVAHVRLLEPSWFVEETRQ